ncbi:hypothetical protein [Wenyingzhuangia aestuarii]|uniref:hypothetical protein n=1 Tax=Wenyingzhuangia aestuarii TaxID=1647582 RepID=UPI00143A650A|nr:hypothetical protein [Wenyingzhuangia aestuarii]NJB81654.1 hypothetical protein [Wenyingzhuangia aestuarii]
MKYFLNTLKLILILLVVSCTTEEKELPQVSLVPVYTINVAAPSNANNTLSGYKSVTVPTTINIYRETDLVIHYQEENNPVNYYVSSTDESTAFVPAGTNPAVEGKYKINYVIGSEENTTNAETGTVTKTKETTTYVVEANNTDIDGNKISVKNSLGLTINHTKKVTVIADKEIGDVNVSESITPATDNDGEITTETIVDEVNNTTTTIITTVSKAVSLITLKETEVYN